MRHRIVLYIFPNVFFRSDKEQSLRVRWVCWGFFDFYFCVVFFSCPGFASSQELGPRLLATFVLVRRAPAERNELLLSLRDILHMFCLGTKADARSKVALKAGTVVNSRSASKGICKYVQRVTPRSLEDELHPHLSRGKK